MISLVEQERDRQRLLSQCEKTAFGCKIAAIAGSYGFDKGFACFWLDSRSDVVFCQVDGLMLLSGTVVEPEETRAFFRAVGPQAVLCAVKNAEALGLPMAASGDVLKKRTDFGTAAPFPVGEAPIRAIYALLEETGMAVEFEPFYLDLSHRLRHGGAFVFTESREGTLAGCAVVSAVSQTSAVLSALAVKEAYRRQGIGSSLVRRVEAQCPGKTLYVFRDRERNRSFYRELGYAKTDTWVQSNL